MRTCSLDAQVPRNLRADAGTRDRQCGPMSHEELGAAVKIGQSAHRFELLQTAFNLATTHPPSIF